MGTARFSSRRRIVPPMLILLVVSTGFLLLFWQHLRYVEFEHQLDRNITNETGRMAIGTLLVSDLQRVKAYFFQMIPPMDDKRMRLIQNQALLGLAEIRDALNVLERGGVIMRKIPVNTVMGKSVTFPVVYFPREKTEYNLPVLSLRPQLEQLEELIRQVPAVVRERDQIMAQGTGQEIKPRLKALMRFLKKSRPLFTRMEENANTLAHESRLNLRAIKRRSIQARKAQNKKMFWLATAAVTLILCLVTVILRQIVSTQFLLEDEVERRTRELKQANQDLAQERNRWQRTFDAIPDIITIQAPDFTILQTNRAGKEFFAQQGEIIGHKCYSVFHGSSSPCENCPVPAMRQLGTSLIEEVEHPIHGKWFQEGASPIMKDGRLHYVVHVARDITEQKAMERNFLQAQKMESVGRLAGGVAHDFNNILSAINGYAELSLMAMGSNAPGRSDVELILKAGHRAARLIQQLLAFSRKQVIERIPLDLNAEIEDHYKMLVRILGEDIEIHFSPDPDLKPVLADRAQLGQILLNLAVNSRDAMPDGGHLRINTKNILVDEDFSRLHSNLAPGPYAVLSVSDNGRGIPADIIDHIFDPFFTTKEKGRGTGLGLATIHGIVKQHNGEITVYSEPGLGTTFRIYLPQARRLSPKDAVGPAEVPRSPLPQLTVLLAEDERLIREMLARSLRSEGCTVLEAEDGEKGAQVYGQHKKKIDLLITDVVMPGLNGPELAKRLWRLQPNLAVIFMSGYAETDILNPEHLPDHCRFVQKPVTPARIRAVIAELADRFAREQDGTIESEQGGNP